MIAESLQWKKLAVVGAACVLTGCATTSEFEPQFYPSCYQPIQQVQKDRDYTAEARQAVVSGVVGALVGAVVGYSASKDSSGAVVGAVAGGVVGATAGFVNARLSKIKDQEQRLSELKVMLGEEANNLDLDRASVLQSFRCYSQEMDDIQKSLKSGAMSSEEASIRLAEIKTGIMDANAFWAERAQQLGSRADDFGNYIETETRKNNQQYSVVQALSESTSRQAQLKNQIAAASNEVNGSYETAMNKLNLMLNA